MAQIDKVPDDRLLARTMLCFTDQTAVDLRHADLRQIEHFQTRRFGAEVVDGKCNAARPQLVQQPGQGLQLNALRGFGDLKNQPSGVNAGICKDFVHLRQVVRLYKGIAGNVHIQYKIRPRFPLLEQLTALPQHFEIDHRDHVFLFHHFDKLNRRVDIAMRVDFPD